MNLCTDCRWYDAVPAFGPFCTKRFVSPVDNQPSNYDSACIAMRLGGPCGYDGRWWEKKQ